VLAGALLLLVADTAARTLVAPAEMPVGLLTSILGAPWFRWSPGDTTRRAGYLACGYVARHSPAIRQQLRMTFRRNSTLARHNHYRVGVTIICMSPAY
jgi:hypothetical protein